MTIGKLILAIIALAIYLPWTYLAISDIVSFHIQKRRSKKSVAIRPPHMDTWFSESTKWWNLFHLGVVLTLIYLSIVKYWNTPI